MKELIWKRLETDRLILDKIPKKEVEKGLFSLDEIYFWYGYEIAKPYDPMLIEPDAFSWHLLHKDTGELMGKISLGKVKMPLGFFNFSYIIREKFKMQGFMLEAGKRVLDFAFKELELRMADANIHEFNTPSRKLIEKLGFKVKSYGKNVPHYKLGDGKDLIYQLKRKEWHN